MQIILLFGLLCFYPYMFKAPSGQTYSYFFGVAQIELRGNLILFFGSIIISFLGPCWFYVNRTNLLRHGSLNMSRFVISPGKGGVGSSTYGGGGAGGVVVNGQKPTGGTEFDGEGFGAGGFVGAKRYGCVLIDV